MRPPSTIQIRTIITSLDWSGHIELGDQDILWLSNQLSAALRGDRHICGSCGLTSAIVIQTRLGSICEDCLEEASEQVEDIRDTLEEG